MRIDSVRSIVVAILASALLLIVPRTASAHAHLRRSEPAAGASIAAPRVLRFWFSEEPELSLTSVMLLDSTGAHMALGTPAHDVGGALTVRIAIGQALRPGRYEVRWRTAAMDGHPSSGSFTFRVNGAPSAMAPMVAHMPHASHATPGDTVAGGARVAETPGVQAPAFVLARLVSYVALLVLIGAVTFRAFVLPRLSPAHAHAQDQMLPALATGAMCAAMLFVVVALVRLFLQCRMMQGGGCSLAEMRLMMMGTKWGGVWIVQLAAGIAAAACAWMPATGSRAAWSRLAFLCVVLAFFVALGGHAAAAERARAFFELDDTLHILAASAWLGSLFWLAVIGLRADAGTSRTALVADLVGSFSPVALVSSGIVVATGVASAWPKLGIVSDLWTTPYGQALFRKLVMVALVVLLGAYNWRRVKPVLGTDSATSRLRRSTSIELVVGLLVLLFTALLVATPLT